MLLVRKNRQYQRKTKGRRKGGVTEGGEVRKKERKIKKEMKKV